MALRCHHNKIQYWTKNEGGIPVKRLISMILILVLVALITLPALADNNTIGMIVYNGQQGGKILYKGIEAGTSYNNRITITCGEVLFPETTVGNYTEEQLDEIASKWVEFKIVPNGMLPLVFAGGAKWTTSSGRHEENKGYLGYIGGKDQTIWLRGGELVLWGSLDDMHKDIVNRIVPQIKKGNLDIPSPLAFEACSPEVAGYIPYELLVSNKVRVIAP